MKKLVGILIFLLVVYVIYYDLSQGILSKSTAVVLLEHKQESVSLNKTTQDGDHVKIEKPQDQQLPFKESKVSAGQTVMTVVEQIHDGPLPVSISQLVTDFQILNPNVKPEKIQIGKIYKFPVYSKAE